MQLIFPADKSIELTFKVNIAGTNNQPQSVAVVLERDTLALSYQAHKSGDDYSAVIETPGNTFGPGPVKVSVNVVLNSRLFTPMKTTAEITAVDVVAPAETTTVAVPDESANEVATEVISTVEPIKTDVVLEPVVKQTNVSSYLKKLLDTPTPKSNFVPYANLPKVTTEKAAPLEQVAISQPVRLQLLKSIEPGVVKTSEHVAKRAPIVKEAIKAAPVFKLKRTKVIFK